MANLITTYANPARFTSVARVLGPCFAGLAALSLIVGLYLGLFVSPADYQQGETVRIMYVHVPAAWMSMFVYGVIAVSSLVSIIWRHALADVCAKSAAPVGAAFTFLALVTGSLWGKPMWGTWWEWDARMTSVLILFFIYLAYIALWETLEEPQRAARLAAVFALAGTVMLPIIRFSVDWWNTLHQPASVIRLDGPTIDPSMLWPLLIMGLGYTFLFAAILIVRMRTELVRQQIRVRRLAETRG